MNEIAKTIGIIIVVFFIGGVVGVLGTRAIYQGELSEVRSDLRAAVDISAELRRKDREATKRFRQLAELAEERYQRAERFERRVRSLEKSIQEREEVIESISSGLGGITEDTTAIGELAKRGKAIVRSILEKGPGR